MFRKYIYLLSAALTLASTGCRKPDIHNIKNLNNGKIMIIGHGGSGFQSVINPLPTNSAASVSKALDELEADGVELDVQLTADKQLILYHDARLESQTNCKGCISEQTAADVLPCTYKYKFPAKPTPENSLLHLNDVLSKYAAKQKKPVVFLDTKVFNECNPGNLPDPTEFAKAISTIIGRYKAQDWVHVESSSTELLLALQQLDPQVKLSYYTKSIDTGIATAAKYKFDSITTFNNVISKEQIKNAHEKDLKVIVLGVKSYKGLREAIDKYPDAIQTDNIPRLKRMLQAQNAADIKQQLL